MKKVVKKLIAMAVLGIVAAFWWFYFGVTTATATLDGEPWEGATVEIDGKVVGETPFETHLFPGTHDIRILPPVDGLCEEKEWTGFAWTIVRGVDFEALFHARVAKVVYGSLTVTSTPVHGAAITLDDEPTGMTTPHTFENLSVGAHSVLLFYPGWIDAGELTQPMVVNVTTEGMEVNITLHRDLTGRWQRMSDGLQAEVSVESTSPNITCPDTQLSAQGFYPLGVLCLEGDERLTLCKTHAAECGADSAEGRILGNGRRVEFTTYHNGIPNVYTYLRSD